MNELLNIEQIKQTLKSFSTSTTSIEVKDKYVILNNSVKFNISIFPIHDEIQQFVTSTKNSLKCSKETFKNLKSIFPSISLGQPFLQIQQ